jgi:hypothetical protein
MNAIGNGGEGGIESGFETSAGRAEELPFQQARRQSSSFKEIADEWLNRHARPNNSARAVRDYVSMLERHILPRIGAMRVTEIAKRDLIRLFDEVVAKPDARKGKANRKMTHRPNRVFELVRTIFRWAVGRYLISIDPTSGVAPPIRKEKPRERERQLMKSGDCGSHSTELPSPEAHAVLK